MIERAWELGMFVLPQASLDLKTPTKFFFKFFPHSRPRTTESDYVKIHKGSGCSSYVGKQTYWPGQTVTLQGTIGKTGCFHDRVIVHELIHAWGFTHEQNRHSIYIRTVSS